MKTKPVIKTLLVFAVGLGIGTAGTVLGQRSANEQPLHMAAQDSSNAIAAQAMAAREPHDKSQGEFGALRAILPWQDARLLAEVMERVKRDYVDQLSDEQLIDAAIRGMMSELDPHSAFLDPKQFEDIRISSSGEYSGVGLELAADNGEVRVSNVIEDTPAAQADVHVRDRLVAIDDVNVDAQQVPQTIDIHIVDRPQRRPTCTCATGSWRSTM